MTDQAVQLFSIFGVGVTLTMLVGLYCIVTTRNLIRTLIGVEILAKGTTLLIIVAGKAVEHQALAQALAITMIVIEVAVMAVAVGVVLCLYRHTGSIDTDSIKDMKD